MENTLNMQWIEWNIAENNYHCLILLHIVYVWSCYHLCLMDNNVIFPNWVYDLVEGNSSELHSCVCPKTKCSSCCIIWNSDTSSCGMENVIVIHVQKQACLNCRGYGPWMPTPHRMNFLLERKQSSSTLPTSFLSSPSPLFELLNSSKGLLICWKCSHWHFVLKYVCQIRFGSIVGNLRTYPTSMFREKQSLDIFPPTWGTHILLIPSPLVTE